MSVLKSLSAYQMYRQQIRLRVRGPDVVKFLLQDSLFPRTVYHCLNQMEFCLQKLPAPKNAEILASIAELKKNLTEVNIPELTQEGYTNSSTNFRSAWEGFTSRSQRLILRINAFPAHKPLI